MAPVQEQELFQVGVTVGTHGLRGDLKVKTLTQGSLSLLEATKVVLRRPARGDEATFEIARAATHKGMILLRLKGLENIDLVGEWVGAEVFMALEELPEPGEDEHYWYELVGLTVVDQKLGEIGTLEEIFTTAAHDIFVVAGSHGEVLIPVVDEFILGLDEEDGFVHVDLPEGLVELAESPKTA